MIERATHIKKAYITKNIWQVKWTKHFPIKESLYIWTKHFPIKEHMTYYK